MRTDSTVLDADDLAFCLFDWLQIDRLVGLERYQAHSRETIEDVLDLSQHLAEELFLPHNREADANEPHVVDGVVRLVDGVAPALEAFADAGLIAATMDEDDGGFQLPHVAHRAAFMWFQAANVATASYPMLTAAAAHLIRTHASDELAARYLPPMLSGRWFGTMNLSEPSVGSALGDIRTTAVRLSDGTYRLRGDKMWISGGDHELAENIVHLVLARTGGPGTTGLSLFIVPKRLGDEGALGERNDVALVGLNHKMGYRGTVNTALAYGSGAFPIGTERGAVGYLVGAEGEGLSYMFLMMNEARLGVGASAAALGVTSVLHATRYARERQQGRALEQKGTAEPVPIIRHPDVRRMLLTAKSYAEGATAIVLYTASVLDLSIAAGTETERKDAARLLDVLTPIAKSWPSQWCLAANDLAIQVHGGSGYTRDLPLEQFYRDNRLNPIHEGTHGIQALDLLGRKVRIDEGAGFTMLIDAMRTTVRRAEESGSDLAPLVAHRVARLEAMTVDLRTAADPGRGLGNATTFLEAAGDVVVAWLLLDQVVALDRRNDQFADKKRTMARFFITHLLPRVDPQFALLESQDRQLFDLDDALI